MHSQGSVVAVSGVLWCDCDGGSPEDKYTVWGELDGTGARCLLKEVDEDNALCGTPPTAAPFACTVWLSARCC